MIHHAVSDASGLQEGAVMNMLFGERVSYCQERLTTQYRYPIGFLRVRRSPLVTDFRVK